MTTTRGVFLYPDGRKVDPVPYLRVLRMIQRDPARTQAETLPAPTHTDLIDRSITLDVIGLSLRLSLVRRSNATYAFLMQGAERDDPGYWRLGCGTQDVDEAARLWRGDTPIDASKLFFYRRLHNTERFERDLPMLLLALTEPE